MPNVVKKIRPTKETLSEYLFDLSQEERIIWMDALRTKGGRGISAKVFKVASRKDNRITEHDVHNVMRGISYNKFFAPIVVDCLVKILSESKSESKEKKAAVKFVLNHFI